MNSLFIKISKRLCQIILHTALWNHNLLHTEMIAVFIIAQVHYCDVMIGAIASQITSITIVYSTVYSDADQRKHQSPASLAFVWGIHRGPVKYPHKWPVTRKMFPFDDVIMVWFFSQYLVNGILQMEFFVDLGWCAVCLKSDLSPKLNIDKEELSQT